MDLVFFAVFVSAESCLLSYGWNAVPQHPRAKKIEAVFWDEVEVTAELLQTLYGEFFGYFISEKFAALRKHNVADHLKSTQGASNSI
jgi:hypothetical protein